MSRYEIAGRALTINGRTHAKGGRINLSDETGAALVAAGRLRKRASVSAEPPASATKAALKKRKTRKAK